MRRHSRTLRRYAIEIAVVAAIACLIAQAIAPNIARWWRQPSPGTFGVGRTNNGTKLSSDFLIYLPPQYGNTPYPLVVFLHGGGECGSDPRVLRKFGPFAAVESGAYIPAIIVGPQCPLRLQWEPDAIAQFLEQVCATYNVDRNRIYLIGYSMGATGAYRAVSTCPDMFAAAVAIAGRSDMDSAKSLTAVPIWIFHGTDDDAVPVGESNQMAAAIGAMGGIVRVTIMDSKGHEICNSVCRRVDLWKWLFAQHRRPGD